jgi:hypothetical protein
VVVNVPGDRHFARDATGTCDRASGVKTDERARGMFAS